jgi:hypothetical protein
VNLAVTASMKGTAMDQLLIAELHRLQYADFLRQAAQHRREPRRKRSGRHHRR